MGAANQHMPLAWGEPDISKCEDTMLKMATGRKTRISSHIKSALVGMEQTSGSDAYMAVMVARGSVSKQDCFRWMHDEMNGVTAASHLSLHQKTPHIHCHAGDAARIGKPAVDLHFSTL